MFPNGDVCVGMLEAILEVEDAIWDGDGNSLHCQQSCCMFDIDSTPVTKLLFRFGLSV